MKINIEFLTNGSAFESCYEYESSELKYVMEQVERVVSQYGDCKIRGKIKDKIENNIKDSNGNTIGKVTIK